MAEKIRFYLDENVPIAVAIQLQRRGIEATTVRDLGLLGDTNAHHLRRATAMGCVFCMHDADYIEIGDAMCRACWCCLWAAAPTYNR